MFNATRVSQISGKTAHTLTVAAARSRAGATAATLGARPARSARRSALVAGVALCIAVAGCASVIGRLDPPSVSLVAIRMLTISASGVEVALSLDVANPNTRSIEIASLDFTVEVHGIRVVEGHSREPVSIAAHASGQATIAAMSNFADWTAVARRLSSKSSIDYAITGTAHVNGATLPFSRRGEIDAASLLGRQS